MLWADAVKTFYNAVKYADRWVDENEPDTDLHNMIDKYLKDHGFADEAHTVVNTLVGLLDSAAQRGGSSRG